MSERNQSGTIGLEDSQRRNVAASDHSFPKLTKRLVPSKIILKMPGRAAHYHICEGGWR